VKGIAVELVNKLRALVSKKRGSPAGIPIKLFGRIQVAAYEQRASRFAGECAGSRGNQILTQGRLDRTGTCPY